MFHVTMEKASISALIIAHLCGMTLGLVTEHFYVTEKKSRDNAQQHCTNRYTTLSSIWSQEEAEELSQLAGSKAVKAAWIGLYQAEIEDWRWSTEESAAYFNWQSYLFCTIMRKNGLWHKQSCLEQNPFVCFSVQRYTYVLEQKSWNEAQRHCESLSQNLVTVYSEHQNNAIKNNLTNRIWIGLLNDPWKWSDGQLSHFRDFAPGEPNSLYGDEGCILAHGSGWHDSACSLSWAPHVICCESNVSKTIVNRCQLYGSNESWNSAQAICRQNGKNLPTVYNQQESFDLLNLLSGSTSLNKSYWIGLSRGPDKLVWADRTASAFNNWRFKNHICAMMNTGGTWIERFCFEEHPFACHVEVQSNGIFNYTLVQENKTWPEAQKYCREKYSDLATIRSQQENEALRKATSESATDFWIGLFNNVWRWQDGRQPTFQLWGYVGASEFSHNSKCVVMRNNTWYESKCHRSLPFFCSHEMPEIILVQEKKTWEEALDYCRAKHTDLTSLGLDNEMQIARRKVNRAETAYVWTGLRFLAGTWLWVDGKDLGVEQWGSGGQPQCPIANRCGALSIQSGLWEAWPCEEKLNFLCSHE